MTKHLIFRRVVMLCFCLCLIATGNLFSQDSRGMKITVHTKEGKAIPLYKDSYALVVGNGTYTEGWNPLRGPLQDVEEVAAALKKHGFTVILKKDLTKPKFEEAFDKFVIEGRHENNRLLFYYAGHGHTEKLANGEDLGYLVMVDAPLLEDNRINHRKSVDMESLVTQAKRIQARHVLFVFDSCFSGTILNAGRNQEQPENISYSIQQPVRQFITAGSANEGVPDKSVFKQAFLNLIEGRARQPAPDDYITGEELGFYLKYQVPKYNKAQHPQYGKINDPNLDQGDFVFVLPKEEAWTLPINEFATMATLTVTSTPSGADIYVDNARIGKTPLTDYKVDTGVRREKQVEVGLELSGYKSRVARLMLKGGQQTPWDVRLEKFISQTGTLTVTSTPSGASVYVDGALIGPTPLQDYEIDTGVAREKQAEVGLELSGYKSRVAKLMVRGDQQTPWDVRLEKLISQTGTLTVTSTPSGASVYVDGALIGPTPLQDYEIDTGVAREKQVEIRLELSDYKSYVAQLMLKGGQQTPWDVRLEKFISQTGTLTVTSTPSGASVYVDGALIGPTPLQDYEIDTGVAREKQVEIRLELSGYKSRVLKLMVRGGQQTPWHSRLEAVPIHQGDAALEGMVLVPAGEFQMGSNDGEFDERPVHTVYVDAFYMDVYEVTNAEYKKFVDANLQWRKDHISSRYHDGNYLKHWTENSYGRGNHPVVYVSWYGAMAYAEWVGKRLPTEAEWERAARGGLSDKKYPWGNLLDSSKAQYRGGGTTAVGTYPPNKYGLYDMVGNVWEWCLDAYDGDFYKSSPHRNPIAGADGLTKVTNMFTTVKSSRVLRSGAWSNRSALRVADRRRFNPVRTDNSSGFRCVRTVSP